MLANVRQVWENILGICSVSKPAGTDKLYYQVCRGGFAGKVGNRGKVSDVVCRVLILALGGSSISF